LSFDKPGSLIVNRGEGGNISVLYNGVEIVGAVGIQLGMSEYGAMATLIFPVGTVDVQTKLNKVFGAVEQEEMPTGIPGGN
jgi:hypothetical protein